MPCVRALLCVALKVAVFLSASLPSISVTRSGRHAQFMRAYAASGQAKLLGTTREVVALHHERRLLPIHIHVTKCAQLLRGGGGRGRCGRGEHRIQEAF
jgi:hypothetical protein